MVLTSSIPGVNTKSNWSRSDPEKGRMVHLFYIQLLRSVSEIGVTNSRFAQLSFQLNVNHVLDQESQVQIVQQGKH